MGQLFIIDYQNMKFQDPTMHHCKDVGGTKKCDGWMEKAIFPLIIFKHNCNLPEYTRTLLQCGQICLWRLL